MSRPSHMLDLERRYLEPDWVSEYQRLWAVFNHWFAAHTGLGQDRQSIETFKTDVKLPRWLSRRIRAAEYPRPHTVLDGLAGSYPRFATNNEISSFFRDIELSPTVAARINRPWRQGNDKKVRNTCAITLNGNQFTRAYRLHAQILEEGCADFNLTLHQTLPLLGVDSTGCCYFRTDTQVPACSSDHHYAERLLCLLRSDVETRELACLIDTPTPSNLANDVVESLYNLRNVAVHGSLDFLVASDNAAARVGFDVLDSLLRDIRDHW